MKPKNKTIKNIAASISRRSFIKLTALGALSFDLGMKLSGCSDVAEKIDLSRIPKLGKKSRIKLVRHGQATDGKGRANAKIVQQLVDTAILRLTEKTDLASAWQQFVSPNDVVGIKINAIAAGKGPCTKPEVVQAIVNGLLKAGIHENNIIIWDRNCKQLEKAGYQLNMSDSGVRCFATNKLGSILGKSIGFLAYDRHVYRHGQVTTRFSKIFTEKCTAIINVPVLKDHGTAGITLCLKNMYGCIDNPHDFHENGCDPYIADLNSLSQIRAKVRLHVCDCLQALYHGGPSGGAEWQWNYNGILVGIDPVALDYTGWQIIEEKRRERKMLSLAEQGRAPRFIATAADPQHKLGHNDPNNISLDLIQLDTLSREENASKRYKPQPFKMSSPAKQNNFIL